jgi:integral membrane protein
MAQIPQIPMSPKEPKSNSAALLRFRVMAVLCGVNLLLLILGYMPAKYLFDAIESNKWLIVIPIAHGYLYIVYILTALQLGVQKRMPFVNIVGLVLAGTLPVASFVAERRMVAKYS